MNIQFDLARHLEELRFIHPLSEWLLRLGCKVHQNASLRIFCGRLDDGIETLVSIDKYGRGVIGVEAHQRAVRAIRIEAQEGHRVIDEVLSEKACDDRSAGAPLLAAEQVNICHRRSAIRIRMAPKLAQPVPREEPRIKSVRQAVLHPARAMHRNVAARDGAATRRT